PSEHMDNPEGGQTSEDPRSPMSHAGENLSPQQQAWVAEQLTPRFRQLVEQRAAASGLPTYVEVSKEHARRKLREAVGRGRTPGVRPSSPGRTRPAPTTW